MSIALIYIAVRLLFNVRGAILPAASYGEHLFGAANLEDQTFPAFLLKRGLARTAYINLGN